MTTSQSEVSDPSQATALGVDADELFEVLSNRRRRLVLVIVGDEPGEMPLYDLVADVAKAEYDATSLDEVPDDAVDSLSIHLYHADLPKLAEAGLVEFDPDRQMVAGTARTSGLAERLTLPSS